MGDCLNFLGMEDLKLLEEEMDKAAKVVRECKVDVSGQVKLADFGLAKVVNLKNQGGYRLAVDIWSLGCIVLEMLTRQPPYSDLEGFENRHEKSRLSMTVTSKTVENRHKKPLRTIERAFDSIDGRYQRSFASKSIDSEENVRSSIEGMVGNIYASSSIVGQVVVTGKHRWICANNQVAGSGLSFEMLCEECSHFLEIVEAIRSLGLTILKGATKAHGRKIWICFVVEASISLCGCQVLIFIFSSLAFGCFSAVDLVARRREYLYLYLGGLLSSGLSIHQLHSSSLR
ncbi:hypothetical protein JHK87_025075 [Glycine soja]|nr:hypothetical protein JHK87_025075 [Glycine soja]